MSKEILISRTDNLGDIIYTLPLATIIKKHYPNAKVTFLARTYAKELITLAADVDAFLNWDEIKQASKKTLKQRLAHFDIFINAAATKATARVAKQGKIRCRIGTSRRWYHWLYCNKLVNFSRKKSSKHEVELNTYLLKPLLQREPLNKYELNTLIQYHKTEESLAANYLTKNKFNLIIHPFSNGNGRQWPIDYFISLIKLLPEQCHIILTGGPGDKSQAEEISRQCPNITNTVGETSLNSFLSLIDHADGLLASGTGPLHIASTMNKPCLGLFPPKKSMSSQRWAPLGKNAHYLENKPEDEFCRETCSNIECACMQVLTPEMVKKEIVNWL